MYQRPPTKTAQLVCPDTKQNHLQLRLFLVELGMVLSSNDNFILVKKQLHSCCNGHMMIFYAEHFSYFKKYLNSLDIPHISPKD